jgi:TetR/AcrR family transcriptional repressor of nem operon
MASKIERKPDETRDTREEILKVAGHLLRSRGFSGFSYAHIAEQLGIKTPAIHYHFPAKADLGLALVERYRDRYRRWMDEARDQDVDPRQQLEGYVRIATRFGERGTLTCPVGAFQADWGALPDEMRPPVRALIDEIHVWLSGVLDDGRARGAFRFEGDAADMARLLAAALQGGLQNARALGDDAFTAVVRQCWRLTGVVPTASAA